MGRTSRRAARACAAAGALLMLAGRADLASQAGSPVAPAQAPADPSHYHPTFQSPPAIAAIERFLPAGDDAFPEEKTAEALASVLNTLGAAIRQRPGSIVAAGGALLGPQFKGGSLIAAETVAAAGALEIARAAASPAATLDRSAFQKELGALVAGFRSLDVAEFLITRIETEANGAGARTIVRFDFSGAATGGGRTERIGHWQIRWQQDAGHWAIAEWTALGSVSSRAPTPVFSEATDDAFGRIPAFATQLTPNLDDWIARLDSTFMPGGMGHHGISAGDADGDGLDDLYISQPSGLPNRLFRNNGDGTFSDITESAGVGVLDSTSQSLFIDIDNDGDEDLVLVTRGGPLLFVNDGKAHFTLVPDAFHLAQPLRGTLTSVAAADYDRDGFVDLYLCAYSFLIGASEDKAGPPTPYHDAQNGPPNVLLHNDGHGRFVEVTDAVGLNEHNDRFSFAATWGDYDEDGWPDLLVANDFGRKNLYRNLGVVNGQVRFKDVTESAGVQDYGAGMSAAFVDYDNDGHLDIYTGNMWTAAGLRVTSLPGFMPQAPPDVRALYQRHARGNSLFRNRGDGTFEDITLKAGAEFGRWAWSSDALDFDNDGFADLFVVNGMFTRAAGDEDVNIDSFFWRQVTARSPLTRQLGTSYDDAWRATNRLLVRHGSQASHERDVLLRNNGEGGFDEVSGTAGLDLDQDGRSFAVLDFNGDGAADVALMSPRSTPQLRLFRNDFASGNGALAVRLIGTRSNRDAIGARDCGHWSGTRHANGDRGIRLHLTAFEGAAVRSRQEHTSRWNHYLVAIRREADAARHRDQPAAPRDRRQRGRSRRAVGESDSTRCAAADGTESGVSPSQRGGLAVSAVPGSRFHRARSGRTGALNCRAGRTSWRASVLGDDGAAVAGHARGAGPPAGRADSGGRSGPGDFRRSSRSRGRREGRGRGYEPASRHRRERCRRHPRVFCVE